MVQVYVGARCYDVDSDVDVNKIDSVLGAKMQECHAAVDIWFATRFDSPEYTPAAMKGHALTREVNKLLAARGLELYGIGVEGRYTFHVAKRCAVCGEPLGRPWPMGVHANCIIN